MGRHSQQGFTIIETVLVLAITGVLIAGLLVGIGSSISTQRYKDAVSSLKTELQSQYSQVNNVTNTRDASWQCGASATPVQGGTGMTPGQSDCVILGRYVAIDGARMTTATIIGYKVANTVGVNDIETIKANYTLGISKDTIADSALEWGAEIAWPAEGEGRQTPRTPRALSILIVRSPTSNTTYTFTSDAVTATGSVNSQSLKAIMVANVNTAPGQKQRYVCIEPDGGNVGPASVPEKLSIYIAKAANGPSSIEIRSFATTESLGGDTKC